MCMKLDSNNDQAQKFGTVDDDDDDLEEESLLETPLDKVEPYGLFKSTLMCKSHRSLPVLISIRTTLSPSPSRAKPRLTNSYRSTPTIPTGPLQLPNQSSQPGRTTSDSRRHPPSRCECFCSRKCGRCNKWGRGALILLLVERAFSIRHGVCVIFIHYVLAERVGGLEDWIGK